MFLLEKGQITVFADGADLDSILALSSDPKISGFTTNPTLMQAAGVTDYQAFAKTVLQHITDRPVSFEVFADDFGEMEKQALEIASWAANVYVKIPISNTNGVGAFDTINRLSSKGVKLNITAIMTMDQVHQLVDVLDVDVPAIISIFAGRIADTGRDPLPIMREVIENFKKMPLAEVLWASPREVLNVYQAADIGCHIITITPDLIKKLNLYNKSLEEYSLDTVKMFYNDALKAGFSIDT